MLFALYKGLIEPRKNLELANRNNLELANKVIEEIDKRIPAIKYTDWELVKPMKKEVIVDDFESWTPNAIKQQDKIKKVIVVDRGKLDRGYVYIRASLNGGPLSNWESIYLNLNNSGGHLLRSLSLPLPLSKVTELLYKLDSVPYIKNVPYSEQKQPLYVDWFRNFIDNRRVNVYTFISSLRPAKIEKIYFLLFLCRRKRQLFSEGSEIEWDRPPYFTTILVPTFLTGPNYLGNCRSSIVSQGLTIEPPIFRRFYDFKKLTLVGVLDGQCGSCGGGFGFHDTN